MKQNRKLILYGLVLGLLILTSLAAAGQTLATQSSQAPNTNGTDSQTLPQETPSATPPPDDNTGGQPVSTPTFDPSIQPPNVDESKAQTPPATSAPLPDDNTGTGVQGVTSQGGSNLRSTDAMEVVQFPKSTDDIGVGDYPYWWQMDDYAQGVRTLSINTVSAVRINLAFDDNTLNTTGHVDLDLSINGTVVGSVSILPGDTEITAAFFFAPISTPNYTIRLEETNTVDPGAGSVAISISASTIAFFDSTTSLFPGTGDTLSIVDDPYWWHTGDYAQGVRTLGLNQVYGIRYDLVLLTNSLNGTGHIDMDLSINGTVVGSFTILPGELTKTVIYFFSPASGPTYTVRMEETNTVDPGAGSVIFAMDTSQIHFYDGHSSWFPRTGDVVDVGDDPYWWQLGDYAEGTRSPGLDHVTGIQFELLIDDNALNTTGHIDLDLSVNGTVVGSFSIWPGDLSKTVSFSFAPISGPLYTVRLEETNTVDPGAGSASILLDTSVLTFYNSTLSRYLPAVGDIIDVAADPYWWSPGDYAEGTRITHIGNITGISYDLFLMVNSLNTTGHVDLNLSINGVVVDSFTILPGEMSISRSTTFAPIYGPVYVIRLEETNLVDPGAGSIVIPLDRSQFQFVTNLFLPLVLR